MTEGNIFWPSKAPEFTAEALKLLTTDSNDVKPALIRVEEIIQESQKFPIEFPVSNVRCKYLETKVSNSNLERYANSAYPILHESALPLFTQFLLHKKRFGSKIEKKFYEKITVEQLVDRLLSKRAVVFYGRGDSFMLCDGLLNHGSWDIIGTDNERPPRVLENCLSYDEIKLSALLSVTSYTHFINNGSRDNCGIYSNNRNDLEDFGVIIGLIGARFEKPGFMEYQECVVSKEQNNHHNGYGESFVPTMRGCFMNFYGELSLTYNELIPRFSDTKKYTQLRNETYFNNEMYKKRLALSIDTLLIEANERAQELDKMAYVHVVGFGLGVWKISSHQNKMFMRAFAARIRLLGTRLLHVSDICFAYIGEDHCGPYKDQDIVPISAHKNGGLKIHFKDRDPHTKLRESDEGKLLVVSYAWDGNALPGNEYWLGQLTASGDPAAACSTQIAELHNWHINAKVSASNLRIATLNGVETFRAYAQKLLPSTQG